MSLRPLLSELRLYCCNRIVSQIPSHTIRLAFYRQCMGFDIGVGTSIHLGTRFQATQGLTVGRFSVINQECRLDTRGAIHIGDYTSISPEVTILTTDHDPHSPTFAGRARQVTIGNHVWIGTRAILLSGIIVGDGAVIAAGAVVTKNVAPFKIVAGVPAREIGERSKDLHYGGENGGYFRLFQ